MSSRPNRRSLKVDRISELPDPLICQILYHLPTKDAVKTSVLSTRWRDLWLWVPALDLTSRKFRDFNAFLSFCDGFFDSSKVSRIDRVKLAFINVKGVDDAASTYLTPWMDAAVKRKVKHLHLRVRFSHRNGGDFYEIPLSLYVWETLVSLTLDEVELATPEFISLPCLKSMQLKNTWYPNDASFERFVSSCPVLEELGILGFGDIGVKVFRVVSRSLKRLTLSIGFSLNDIGSGVVIDAPRLCVLSMSDTLSESFVITNMDSNVKLVVSLHSHFTEINRFRSFLPVVSKIKDMTILGYTFKLMYDFSKQEPLPRFGNMSRVQVAFSFTCLNWLPTFLESFPNLKSLVLVCNDGNCDCEEMDHISFSYVPECLWSSLEFVDFNFPIWGHTPEMKLVKYFFENSAILKKVNLRLNYCAVKIQDGFVKKLLKIPRLSTECKIAFLG